MRWCCSVLADPARCSRPRHLLEPQSPGALLRICRISAKLHFWKIDWPFTMFFAFCPTGGFWLGGRWSIVQFVLSLGTVSSLGLCAGACTFCALTASEVPAKIWRWLRPLCWRGHSGWRRHCGGRRWRAVVGKCCVHPSCPELGAESSREQSCSDRARGAPCGVLASIPRRQRCWP